MNTPNDLSWSDEFDYTGEASCKGPRGVELCLSDQHGSSEQYLNADTADRLGAWLQAAATYMRARDGEQPRETLYATPYGLRAENGRVTHQKR